jgi:hypothetical protein
VTEIEKATLQLRSGQRCRAAVVVQQRTEGLGAPPAMASLDHVVDGSHVDQLEALSVLEGALKLGGGEDLGEVEEGVSDGGNRDRVTQGAVVRVKPARMMDSDPPPAHALGAESRDVYLRAEARPEAPERSCALVASSASLPQASTAAIHRPSPTTRGWPTA